MALREKLEEDIKTSMRNRDQARLDALRFLKFAVQAVEKEQKKELDDAGMIEVATKQASDRRDSVRAFEEGGRDAMAAKESAELVVLEEFLPPQMSVEEISQLIKDAAAEVGAVSIQDKGKLMGKLMPQVRGKADGTIVNQMATEYLESLA
ncbi:MAG: GatB/YqeY domain-containing protein [Chloroflexi bacterium]|nr:GatB/YqeY domain-containing protein [Chloroflexota bacterium]